MYKVIDEGWVFLYKEPFKYELIQIHLIPTGTNGIPFIYFHKIQCLCASYG